MSMREDLRTDGGDLGAFALEDFHQQLEIFDLLMQLEDLGVFDF